MTSSSSGNVALGAGAAAVKLNATNIEYLSDGDAATTGKSPTLKFTLDTVPTGSGSATIKATITDGSDATRSGTEDQISLTVNVSYMGNGTSATLKAEAGSATGSYDKGDGTSVSFSVTNDDADWFSMTAASEVSGLPATLDVKLEKLVSLMNASSSAGDLTPLTQLGTYNVAIETTLPLKNAALETVTTFSGNVELVASTTKDTVYGTAGADSITGGATSEIIFGGTGKDTIATGDGADFIVLAAGDGSTTLANSNTVSDFTNTTSTVVGDKFALDGLTFSDLTIEADATTPADTVISVTSTSEYLMTVTGVAYGYINTEDFIVVADIA
jgi:Ca2+-binding RTX toxin-like protein